MLRYSSVIVLPALTLLITACGPSMEAVPGKDVNLAWNELASLNLDDGRPQQARQSTEADRCMTTKSFKYEAATQQITMRSCNAQGVPETAAFRLGEVKKQRLSGDLESLRVRKLNSPMQTCLQTGPGLSRIVIEDKQGNKETFAALEALTPGAPCDSPETIDGVFSGSDLTQIIADFEQLARRT